MLEFRESNPHKHKKGKEKEHTRVEINHQPRNTLTRVKTFKRDSKIVSFKNKNFQTRPTSLSTLRVLKQQIKNPIQRYLNFKM